MTPSQLYMLNQIRLHGSQALVGTQKPGSPNIDRMALHAELRKLGYIDETDSLTNKGTACLDDYARRMISMVKIVTYTHQPAYA